MERLKTREDRIALFEAKLKPIILQSTEDDSKLRKLVAANVKKWGVRPGTQIFYRGAFGTQMLEHHGVYIGYGIVCEVGGKWCKTGQFANGDFRKQCLSFNTLNNFALRGNGVVYEVKYDHIDLDDLGVLREQLKRAIQLTKHSDWNYNPFTHNCPPVLYLGAVEKQPGNQNQPQLSSQHPVFVLRFHWSNSLAPLKSSGYLVP